MARSNAPQSLLRVLTLARRLNAAEEGRPAPLPEPQPGWSRRHFLKGIAAAAAVGALPGTPARATSQSPQNRPRIAILGAGLAGLNAAYQLKKHGIASTVYEARTRVGGRVFTLRNAFGQGSVTDMGAELVNTNHAEMLQLAADFHIGLFDRLSDAAATGLAAASFLIDGQVVPEATVAQAFRAIARQIGKDAAKLDKNWDHFSPIFDSLSCTAYLDENEDKIPAPWVRELLEESVRTEYGVEPDEASSLVYLFNLPVVNGSEFEMLGGSDERFLVAGGSGAIPEAMAASLGASVRLGASCTGIARVGSVYQLTFETGPLVEADILICALPLTVLRRLPLHVSLPEKFLRYIREVDLGINEKVIAGFNTRFWRSARRFANEFWATEEFASAWDASQRQPSLAGGSLTFFTGSKGSKQALQGSTLSKASEYVATLSHYYPEAATAFNHTAVRTNWLTDPRTLGAYTNFAPGQTTEFAEFSWSEDPTAPANNTQVRFDNAYFIGEHTSAEFYGFMEGAAETGHMAAKAVLAQLGVA